MDLVGFILFFTMTLADTGPLEQICPVEWRGQEVSAAFSELELRLGLHIMIDPKVDKTQFQREIRLSASHLTGTQVLQWLGRLSDLKVQVGEKTVIVMPSSGSSRGLVPVGPDAAKSGPGRPNVWSSVASRRAGIHWKDTPLSRVAGDISSGFAVDVIYDGGVLEDAGMVTLDHPSVDLQQVCHDLAEQLQASVEFVDGALWVHRGQDVNGPPWPSTQPKKAADSVLPVPALTQSVHLTLSVTNWDQWAEELNRLTGDRILMEIPPQAAYPIIEAEGRFLDVLEAGRLLGVFTWTAKPGQDGRGTISVRIQAPSNG